MREILTIRGPKRRFYEDLFLEYAPTKFLKHLEKTLNGRATLGDLRVDDPKPIPFHFTYLQLFAKVNVEGLSLSDYWYDVYRKEWPQSFLPLAKSERDVIGTYWVTLYDHVREFPESIHNETYDMEFCFGGFKPESVLNNPENPSDSDILHLNMRIMRKNFSSSSLEI